MTQSILAYNLVFIGQMTHEESASDVVHLQTLNDGRIPPITLDWEVKIL